MSGRPLEHMAELLASSRAWLAAAPLVDLAWSTEHRRPTEAAVTSWHDGPVEVLEEAGAEADLATFE